MIIIILLIVLILYCISRKYEFFTNKKEPIIVHYCIGSFPKSFGGVARYDYHISLLYPNRIWFQGPNQKKEMLEFLEKKYDECKQTKQRLIIITDNHLSLDIPNKYNIILVHHGNALIHKERDQTWTGDTANLCIEGQQKMFNYRDSKTTKIISCSTDCLDSFNKQSNEYKNFKKTIILHSSEIKSNIYNKKFNKKPIIIGNWKKYNKGETILPYLKRRLPQYEFINIQTSNTNDINEHNNEISNIYNNADIYLQLSVAEGFSYSCLDGFNHNLLICGTNVGLLYKDVPKNIFVKINWKKRDDIEYVAKKIEYLWNNKYKYKNKSKKWFDKKCNMKKWKRKTKKFIESSF
tara:strand:- start:1599 stop:2648 length:1050 start_codon:yes stop_codon:yes gene_type:complete